MMNVDLLLRVADIIEKRPERYDQAGFIQKKSEDSGDPYTACGTSHCVAGWAIMLARPDALIITKSTYSKDGFYVDFDDELLEDICGPRGCDWGEGVEWQAGAKLLGLTRTQADVLFNGRAGPKDKNMGVPEALRLIAQGKRVASVWSKTLLDDD